MKASRFLLAFAASVTAATGVTAQTFDTAQSQVRQEQDQRQDAQRREHRGGYRLEDGNSRSGQSFDNASRRNDQQWSYPRQNRNGYDQFQNFEPDQVYLPDRASGRPTQCVIGGNMVDPGNYASDVIADQYTCRPLLQINGAHNLVRVSEYGLEGGGVRYIDISLSGGQATGARIGRAVLPAGYAEALLDREVAGVRAGTSLDGPQLPEVRTIREWVLVR